MYIFFFPPFMLFSIDCVYSPDSFAVLVSNEKPILDNEYLFFNSTLVV